MARRREKQLRKAGLDLGPFSLLRDADGNIEGQWQEFSPRLDDDGGQIEWPVNQSPYQMLYTFVDSRGEQRGAYFRLIPQRTPGGGWGGQYSLVVTYLADYDPNNTDYTDEHSYYVNSDGVANVTSPFVRSTARSGKKTLTIRAPKRGAVQVGGGRTAVTAGAPTEVFNSATVGAGIALKFFKKAFPGSPLEQYGVDPRFLGRFMPGVESREDVSIEVDVSPRIREIRAVTGGAPTKVTSTGEFIATRGGGGPEAQAGRIDIAQRATLGLTGRFSEEQRQAEARRQREARREAMPTDQIGNKLGTARQQLERVFSDVAGNFGNVSDIDTGAVSIALDLLRRPPGDLFSDDKLAIRQTVADILDQIGNEEALRAMNGDFDPVVTDYVKNLLKRYVSLQDALHLSNKLAAELPDLAYTLNQRQLEELSSLILNFDEANSNLIRFSVIADEIRTGQAQGDLNVAMDRISKMRNAVVSLKQQINNLLMKGRSRTEFGGVERFLPDYMSGLPGTADLQVRSLSGKTVTVGQRLRGEVGYDPSRGVSFGIATPPQAALSALGVGRKMRSTTIAGLGGTRVPVRVTSYEASSLPGVSTLGETLTAVDAQKVMEYAIPKAVLELARLRQRYVAARGSKRQADLLSKMNVLSSKIQNLKADLAGSTDSMVSRTRDISEDAALQYAEIVRIAKRRRPEDEEQRVAAMTMLGNLRNTGQLMVNFLENYKALLEGEVTDELFAKMREEDLSIEKEKILPLIKARLAKQGKTLEKAVSELEAALDRNAELMDALILKIQSGDFSEAVKIAEKKAPQQAVRGLPPRPQGARPLASRQSRAAIAAAKAAAKSQGRGARVSSAAAARAQGLSSGRLVRTPTGMIVPAPQRASVTTYSSEPVSEAEKAAFVRDVKYFNEMLAEVKAISNRPETEYKATDLPERTAYPEGGVKNYFLKQAKQVAVTQRRKLLSKIAEFAARGLSNDELDALMVQGK
jgi:hypothetical protein